MALVKSEKDDRPPPPILSKLDLRLDGRASRTTLTKFGENAGDYLRGMLNGGKSPSPTLLTRLADAICGLVREKNPGIVDLRKVAEFWEEFKTDLQPYVQSPLTTPPEASAVRAALIKACGLDTADTGNGGGDGGGGPGLANPFVCRKGITNPAAFFGRKNELRRLRDSILEGEQCQIIAPRRMGKSSLLLAMGRNLEQWFADAGKGQPLFAYLDMQDSDCQTQAGWLKHVAEAWRWKDIPGALADFSKQLQASLKTGLNPVLAMDE